MRLGTNNTVIVVGANLSLLWLVLVTGHVGPDHRRLPDDTLVPARMRGHHCYHLTFTAAHWDARLTPHEIELADSVLRVDPIWRAVWLLDEGRPRLFWWLMAGTDSIELELATGGAIGVIMRASTRTDTLTGRAWAAYDSPAQPWVPPDASARAVPIPCERSTRAARRAP